MASMSQDPAPYGSSFWSGRRVFLTGGAGFLGAHLAKTLVDRCAHVTAYDAAALFPWQTHDVLGVSVAKRVQGDLTRYRDIAQALLVASPSVVIHLAGQSHIAPCQTAPREAFSVNVLGTMNLLEACRAYWNGGGHLDSVLLASSNHVNAETEVDWPRQQDVYGATKVCVDALGQAYAGAFGLPVASLRHQNAYGPADPHASHIVTATCLSLLRGERPVILSDGSPVKGYLDVADVVRAYLLLAETRETGIWHAATEPVSVVDLVRRLIRLSGVAAEPDIRGTDRSQRGYEERMSSVKLRALGWTPTPLDDGLARTLAWYRQHGMGWVKP